MFKKKKILAIIPARAGSKGIKKKNLKKVGSLSLVEIAIKNTLKSKYIDKIVISSNDNKILNLSKKYKKIFFLERKKKLSTDKSKMFDVVKDVYQKVDENYDFIMILQVTCPFRTAKDIDKSVQKLVNSECNTLISVTKMEDFHPARMYKLKNNLLVSLEKQKSSWNRQSLPLIYHRNGLIYLFKSKNLKSKNFIGSKILPYRVNKDRSVNIDDKIDLIYAKALQKKITFS